jgi:hypothetical protein
MILSRLFAELIMSTTLEILAPYLPYGIEVEVGLDEGECERKQLQSITQDGYPRSRKYGREEAELLSDMLPVLYPFSVLGNQANVFRTDHAAHAAIMELAAALNGCDVVEIACAGYSAGHGRERIWLEYQNDDGDLCEAEVWDNGAALDANKEPIQMADWLRKRHFAVGLIADQYIRKES